MAKRGRPLKVTKFSLLNAISRCLTIADTARCLGVDRHTVYSAAKRFEVDLSTVFQPNPTPATVPSLPPFAPEPAKPMYAEPPPRAPRPEPNALRLTADDFTGRNLGDTGSRAVDMGSRYSRLKGY
jgi:hypothetical protein